MKKPLRLAAAKGQVFLSKIDFMQSQNFHEDNSFVLSFDKVCFRWPQGSVALNKCSFILRKPGLWMLVGKNGSGKSTLFRLISGMLKPQSGSISYSLKPFLMFQNPDHQLLMPSCRSELLLSVNKVMSINEKNKLIRSALEDVEMSEMIDRPIHTLSGGQKQRLALADAIVSGANLLLLDEPTALLDPESQSSVLRVVKKLSTSPNRPITAVWITHRLEELKSCDGAAIMEKGSVGQWLPGIEIFEQLKSLA